MSGVSARIWHWYSGDQAMSASTFAWMAKDLEAAPPPPSVDEAQRGLISTEVAYRRHTSFSVASVMASGALLEASINELVASAAHSNLAVGGDRDDASRRKLCRAAEALDRMGSLEKYEHVLVLLDLESFDRGRQPFQDVALVRRLRNALVHFAPRWREALAGEESQGFELALERKGFRVPPFAGEGNPFFPTKCLGYDCAAWALRSVLDYVDAFHRRLGVTPGYEAIRSEIESALT